MMMDVWLKIVIILSKSLEQQLTPWLSIITCKFLLQSEILGWKSGLLNLIVHINYMNKLGRLIKVVLLDIIDYIDA